MYYDTDSEVELMMLPTDMALTTDPAFLPYVKKYAEDKDAFFADFSAVFDKLMELGIRRDASGNVSNTDNAKGGYHSAPKKKDTPGSPKTTNDKVQGDEGKVLKQENERYQAKL